MGFTFEFKPLCFGNGPEADEECDECKFLEECEDEIEFLAFAKEQMLNEFNY